MKRTSEYRIKQKERKIKNRVKFLKDTKQKGLLEHCENKINQLATKHPNDCGKANCKICGRHKQMGNSLKEADEHMLVEQEILKETEQETNESL